MGSLGEVLFLGAHDAISLSGWDRWKPLGDYLLTIHAEEEVLVSVDRKAISGSNVYVDVGLAPNYTPDQLVNLQELVGEDRTLHAIFITLHSSKLINPLWLVPGFKLIAIFGFEEGWQVALKAFLAGHLIVVDVRDTLDIK